MENNIQTLLNEADKIVKRYEKEDREMGRRFNIYSIAGIERDEVRTHSRMIAELLDPKGSHGQGDLFLKLFLKQFEIVCKVENPIVNYEKRYASHGQVDIEITLDDHYIIIENKVYTGDQFEQMQRYSKIAETKSESYTLFYLTRYGNPPSEYSLGDIQKAEDAGSIVWKKGENEIDLRLISYRDEIRFWLEECVKQSTFVANVKEGIIQYLNLIKKITGVEMTSVKQHLIDKLRLKPEELLTAAEISLAFNSSELRGKILFDFFKKVEEGLEINGYGVIDRQHISDVTQKYLYKKSDETEQPCTEWFERKVTRNRNIEGKKSWESKGFFMTIPNSPSLYLHVEVATDALHYGLVQSTKDEKLTLSNEYDSIAEKNSKVFEARDWSNWSFKWFSNIYMDNMRIFDDKVIGLLTDEKKTSVFVTKIDEDIKAVLGVS